MPMQGLPEPMLVYFTPDFRSANLYQELLADALDDACAHVEFIAYTREDWVTALRQPPDVLHLHWLPWFVSSPRWQNRILGTGAFLSWLVLLRIRGARVAWTVHNLESHDTPVPKWERFVRSSVGRIADVLFVHYPDAVEIVRSRFSLSERADIRIALHGAYPVESSAQRTGRGSAATADRSQSDVRFLFLGLVRRYKQVPVLIRSFRDLPSARAKLVIAGNVADDELESDIREAAVGDPRIRLRLEWLEDSEVDELLQDADVVVIPQLTALTSGTALLAMSYGKAVIAADTPHMRYLLQDDGGIRFSSTGPTALAGALAEMCSADFARMGERNRAVAASFTWQESAAEICRGYRAATSR